MANLKHLRLLHKESWKNIRFHKGKGFKYAVSNHGRLVRFKKQPSDGFLVSGSLQEGYPIWRYSWYEKSVRMNGAKLFHHLVAAAFLPKPKKDQIAIIHRNYKKTDNRVSNLAWATQLEVTAHAKKNPAIIEAKKSNAYKTKNAKLTEKQVISIKRLIKEQKTLKEIAAKYGVSDMQIYRIKKGENWSHIK